MIEYYLEIRQVHIYAILTSGGLLLLRGLAILAGARWVTSAPFRYLDYSIHTVILTAAMMLMVITEQYPFVQGWLTIKVTLYLAYLTLSLMALQPQPVARKKRTMLWLSALLVFGFIYSVARARHPLGLFSF